MHGETHRDRSRHADPPPTPNARRRLRRPRGGRSRYHGGRRRNDQVGIEPGREPSSGLRGRAFSPESNENVDISGTVHVVVRLGGSESSGWTLDWRANLDSTSGIGQTTGDRYVARGADGGTVTHPPSPIRSATFDVAFILFPPGPPTHPRIPAGSASI